MQGEIFDEFIENLNLQAQEELLENLRMHLQVHVISMEYPGYGIFQSKFQERHLNEPAGLGNQSLRQKAIRVTA